MYRVKKADGWNRYKIQERWMWFLWKDYGGAIFTSKHQANEVILDMMIQYAEDSK